VGNNIEAGLGICGPGYQGFDPNTQRQLFD